MDCYLGIDIMQDNAGSIFDNFLVTDNFTYAQEMAQDVFFNVKPLEEKVFARWGGNERWEKQRDWGLMDVGNSKKLSQDKNGNVFGNSDNSLYKNTHQKIDLSSVGNSLDSHGFNERDDL